MANAAGNNRAKVVEGIGEDEMLGFIRARGNGERTSINRAHDGGGR
jgi:hypothetical protein